MENNTLLVYTSYPKVLFDHAKKHNLIKEYFLNAQKVLNILLEDDGKLNNFLKDLTIEKADRKKIIEEIFKDHIQNFFLWFLYTIVDFNRCYYLEGILKNFISLCDKEFGINYVKIYSPYQLNDKQIDKLTEALKKHYQKEIRITNIVDKTLIGGIKIVSDVDSINTSLIDKLNHIKYSSIRSLSRIPENQDERKK